LDFKNDLLDFDATTTTPTTLPTVAAAVDEYSNKFNTHRRSNILIFRQSR
jgi:hypothetical protein